MAAFNTKLECFVDGSHVDQRSLIRSSSSPSWKDMTAGKRCLKIGMVDADLLDNGTRHPNLAQMKMSSYCKQRGHLVRLLFDDDLNNIESYDAIIISKVFTFSKLPKSIQKYIPADEESLRKINYCIKEQLDILEKQPFNGLIFMIGGTGFFPDGGRNLYYDIEHIMPDYHLYDEFIDYMVKKGRKRSYYDDYENYSIGFITRGCFRKCDFCVNKKYNKAEKHSPVKEFFDPSRPAIYLWDDNFFALFNEWEGILDELMETGRPFQFRQGLDIRLLKEKHAEKLSKCKYHGDFIFAFDHIEDKELIIEKLTLWRKYCLKTTKMYVLCAFDAQNRWDGISDFKELELKDVVATFERIRVLMTFGCLPYVMRYEHYKKSHFKDIYTQLARWCNQPQFFKKMSFREFCIANQDYHKQKNTLCSALKAMVEFEEEYPEIAKKYFDLRYDKLNNYSTFLSYSRKITTPCPNCGNDHIKWESIIAGKGSRKKIVKQYLYGSLDFTCICKTVNPMCSVNPKEAAQKMIELLLETSMKEIVDIIDEEPDEKLEVETIPQISDYSNGTINLINILDEHEGKTFTEIGHLLNIGDDKSNIAQNKYGENHAKLGALLDLAFVETTGNKSNVLLSPIGSMVKLLEPKTTKELLNRLLFRIPIIRQLVKETKNGDRTSIFDGLSVIPSKKTRERRKPSVYSLIKVLTSTSDHDFYARISLIE